MYYLRQAELLLYRKEHGTMDYNSCNPIQSMLVVAVHGKKGAESL